MNHYDYDGHIKMINALYKSRRDLMMKIVSEDFPKEATYEKPTGGLFLWVSLPDGKDSRELLKLALEENVAFVPGASFYPKNAKINEMRINFSNMSEEKIIEGITTLGKIMKKFINE
jgi:2-aminoadipate transaminase